MGMGNNHKEHPRMNYPPKPPREGLHPPRHPASWKRQNSLQNRLPPLPIEILLSYETKYKLITMGFLDNVKAGAKDFKESAKSELDQQNSP